MAFIGVKRWCLIGIVAKHAYSEFGKLNWRLAHLQFKSIAILLFCMVLSSIWDLWTSVLF